jgi:hypothetical protein
MAIICIPLMFLPGVIGIALLFRNPGDQMTRMAALLTLKPYLTTPIWLFLLALGGSNNIPIMAFIAILPGALLSAWTYSRHENLITGGDATFASRLLFGLDCFRWINSLVLGLFFLSNLPISPAGDGPIAALGGLSMILGIGLPVLYSLIALGVTSRVPEKAKRKPKRKNDDLDEIVEI